MANPVQSPSAKLLHVGSAVLPSVVMAEVKLEGSTEVAGYVGGVLEAAGAGAAPSKTIAGRARVLTYPEAMLREALVRIGERTRVQIDKVLKPYCEGRFNKAPLDLVQLSNHIIEQFKSGQFCLGCALIHRYNMYSSDHISMVLGGAADFWIGAVEEAEDIAAYFNTFMDWAAVVHTEEFSDYFFLQLSTAFRDKGSPMLQTMAALRIKSKDQRNVALRAVGVAAAT